MVAAEQKQANAFATKTKKANLFLWILIVVLVAGGVFTNYFFSNVAVALRLSGWLILACVLVLLVFRTTAGEKLWKFAKEARGELRKIVWPKREETVRTTMMVVAMVVFVALVLWGIDSILLGIINWATGTRG